MPRKRLRLDEDECDMAAERDKLEEMKKCNALLNELKSSEPSSESLNANEALCWALSQSPFGTVLRTLELVKEVGHLGQEVLQRCINFVAEDEAECVQMTRIAPCLFMHRKTLPSTGSATVILATPNDRCICGKAFLKSGCRFGLANVYELIDVKRVPVLRIYCRECNAVNYPFSADRHEQTAARKSKGVKQATAGKGTKHRVPRSGTKQTAACKDKGTKKLKKKAALVDELEENEEENDEDLVKERQYYDYKDVAFVPGNRANYFSVELCEMFASKMSHAWVSAIGFTESFNEAFKNLKEWRSPNSHSIDKDKRIDRKVLSRAFREHEIWRDLIKRQTDQLQSGENLEGEMFSAAKDKINLEVRSNGRGYTSKKEKTRGKQRNSGSTGRPHVVAKSVHVRVKINSPRKRSGAGTSSGDRPDSPSGSAIQSKKLIRGLKVDQYFRSAQFKDHGIYSHRETDDCLILGCKWYAVCDGNWKIQYPLCMFQEMRRGIGGAMFSINCKEEPFRRRAFCEKHCAIMQEKGFPTDVRQFMEKCRSSKGKEEAVNTMLEDFTRNRENAIARSHGDDTEAIDGHISDVADMLSDDDAEIEDEKPKSSKPVTRATAKQQMLTDVQNQLVSLAEVAGVTSDNSDDSSVEAKLIQLVDIHERAKMSKCFKNTGGKKRLNHWLRGHFFIVYPCGQIARWEPLYGSESPSQAFLIMMDHLKITLASVEKSEWHKYTLVYDNMCNVAGMKIARKPLPTKTVDGEALFDPPINEAFPIIGKAIDKLHLSNHVDPHCKRDYNPEKIQKLHPDILLNTMRCEETFVWLSRFKKILCAQPKSHHHFYLHRLITRRNRYTEWKISLGDRPYLPKARSLYTQ